jgi:hypothetical protein
MMCREIQELLPEYSAEALSRQRMARVRAHLDGCAACAREWAMLGGALRLVEQFGGVEPPPGLWDAVSRQIESETRAPRRARPWWAGLLMLPPGARMAPVGLAAVALAVVVWGFWPGGAEGPERPPVRLPVLAQEPEMVAAVQQHSLASAGLFFGNRAGLESVVQIVRRHEEVP